MIHLDSDTAIEILRGDLSLAKRVKSSGTTVAISAIVLAELSFGAAGSRNPVEAVHSIDNFLEKVLVVPFGPNCAREYGRIRLILQRTGRMPGATDIFIAAPALAYGATLVTHNTRHFQHVPGLQLEDWLEAS